MHRSSRRRRRPSSRIGISPTEPICADRGYLIGGGPLVDQDDERLRSISIWTCDAETARRLSNDDPAVQAGRLAVEVMTWMVPAGNVRFEHVPAPRSLADAAEG